MHIYIHIYIHIYVFMRHQGLSWVRVWDADEGEEEEDASLEAKSAAADPSAINTHTHTSADGGSSPTLSPLLRPALYSLRSLLSGLQQGCHPSLLHLVWRQWTHLADDALMVVVERTEFAHTPTNRRKHAQFSVDLRALALVFHTLQHTLTHTHTHSLTHTAAAVEAAVGDVLPKTWSAMQESA
jgi:hypothetical protein